MTTPVPEIMDGSLYGIHGNLTLPIPLKKQYRVQFSGKKLGPMEQIQKGFSQYSFPVIAHRSILRILRRNRVHIMEI
jgi:hypothetical protein